MPTDTAQGEQDYEADDGHGFRAQRIFHRFRHITKVATDQSARTGEDRDQRKKRFGLSPIYVVNVAKMLVKCLILLCGGPGRTRTSNQAVMSAVTALENSAILDDFRARSLTFVLVRLRRFIGHSLVGLGKAPPVLRQAPPPCPS